ncbi:MAG: hypothetical protein ACREUZ_18820, partial [Burkholderiales bacterium]
WTVAALVFVLLAAAHTWPLATNPATLGYDASDTLLNQWIIAWVVHQLPSDPTRLFQGNIFYPATDSLAFSEPLIVPALLAAPAIWLGASPVLAHNLMLLAGFALTGLATYAVVFVWTRDRLAGLLAGSLFAFNAHSLTRLAHVQAQHAYGLPLALLFADRLITHPGRGAALGLAVSMAMMAYTSGYLIVFATVMIGIVLLVRVPDWRHDYRRVAGAFMLATFVAVLLVLPVYMPYRRVATEQGMVRHLVNIRQYSATVWSYAAAPGRVHFSTWSEPVQKTVRDSFFPGILGATLSAVALWQAARGGAQRARVLMLAAIGVAGFGLSLGVRTPIYGLLFAVFPPMQGLRVASRFGMLFLCAIACLAGLGLAGLRERFQVRRWTTALAIASVIIANVETFRAPFTYRRFNGISPVYDLLAAEPGPVVLAETPFYPPRAEFHNADYVRNSTAHWRPMMNGYSGYTPGSYRRIARTFAAFPEERAIQAMRKAGVTHVTVHADRFRDDPQRVIETLSRRPDFELLAIGAPRRILLYRLR